MAPAPDPASLRRLRVRLGPQGCEVEQRVIEATGDASVLGGPAQALLELARAPADDVPLVLSVGPAVVRGLPTAARLSVASRSALDGGLAEGQVGGELAARLATLVDLVVLEGEVPSGHGVLHLSSEGLHVEERPDLVGLSGQQRAEALRARGEVLACGPAARAGVPFAHLSTGHAPASRVGRGGLGRVLARRGLLAICVESPPRPMSPGHARLRALLQASPRLAARSEGGTLELLAQGGGVSSPGMQRHGCHGCPTPCGLSLTRPAQPGLPVRHSGVRPFLELGLAEPEALDLLEACNDWGVDAREVARRLQLEDLDHGRNVAMERAAGRPPLRDWTRTPLEQLAASLSPRGGDPMRTFPFLAHTDPTRLLRIAPDVAWPAGTWDPESPEGAGLLLAWHEDLAAALDSLGFCSFSAAALLADGLLDLDGLGALLLGGEPHDAGARLRAAGAEAVRRAADLRRSWGALVPELPSGWESAAREYHAARSGSWEGPSAASQPSATQPSAGRVELPAVPSRARVPGVVTLAGPVGLFGGVLESMRVELALPAPLGEVLEQAARAHPEARGLLLAPDGLPRPAVWREGRRLHPSALLEDGDTLELVLVVPGG